MPGFALAISPAGGKSQKLLCRLRGLPWLHLGRADTVPLKDGREFAKAAWIKAAAGADPQTEELAARRSGTVAELIRR